MELMKMTSESVIPRKRPLDYSKGCNLAELIKHRKVVPAVRDFPPGCGITEAERKRMKILTKPHSDIGKMTSDGADKLVLSNRVETNDFKHGKIVPAVRDFPRGCGITEAERKPMKILTKAHSDIRRMSSNGDDKLVDSDRVEPNIFISSKPKEFGRNKSFVVSKPAGKVKFWDPDSTKAGYDQKPKATTTTTTHGMPGNVVKNFINVDSSDRKTTLNCKDTMNTGSVEISKLKSFEPKESGRSKSYLASKSSKVKFWDPSCEPQKSEDTTGIVSQKENIRRKKIKEMLTVFDQVYESFFQENRLKPKNEWISGGMLPMEAAKIVKRKLKWMDPGKILGPVCGVQIGDKFKYRALLMMIGLHNQPQSGIDFAKIEGTNLAISIVDAHRYSNESGSSDTLVYSGQGGYSLFGCSKFPPKDQELVRGNRALKNSMDKKSAVRVIRKVKECGKDVFVYDGLYTVDDYTEEKSAEGKIVFKFHLKRVPGQPSLHQKLKW